MNIASPLCPAGPLATLHAQRACFAPSNRELADLLYPIYGRNLDALAASELAIARLVFAQVALMAGAALAADSETFAGAEQLWRDMQDKISAQERALAKRFLELLSRDEYYSESERRLIGVLARTLPGCEDQANHRRAERAAGVRHVVQPKVQPAFAKSSIRLDEAVVARLRLQRDSFAPSNRELTLLFQAEFGHGRNAFRAGELQIARLVFGQVVLMVGAALAVDAETYLGAEQLWSDMQDGIDGPERALARRFLNLLSRDARYTDGERRLIESLAEALPEEEEPLCARAAEPVAEFRIN
jgi:hypothetical protein